MSKIYTIGWVDIVTKSLDIEAESPEEALAKFHKGVNIRWGNVEEVDVEYMEEPYVEDENE